MDIGMSFPDDELHTRQTDTICRIRPHGQGARGWRDWSMIAVLCRAGSSRRVWKVISRFDRGRPSPS